MKSRRDKLKSLITSAGLKHTQEDFTAEVMELITTKELPESDLNASILIKLIKKSHKLMPESHAVSLGSNVMHQVNRISKPASYTIIPRSVWISVLLITGSLTTWILFSGQPEGVSIEPQMPSLLNRLIDGTVFTDATTVICCLAVILYIDYRLKYLKSKTTWV